MRRRTQWQRGGGAEHGSWTSHFGEAVQHTGKIADFDRIWVYVGEDDGHSTYVGQTGTKRHRWTYSLNVKRGPNHWVIIEQLPNEFMDSDKYARSEPVAAPNSVPSNILG